uniref:Hexosyltransferase n=1 Tax=Acrobeloides nanus TaxID=290746 RepID=A0A914CZ19_9BILA
MILVSLESLNLQLFIDTQIIGIGCKDFNTDIRVSQEANKYQDILLFDYTESYYNVSRKIFGYLRYVYDYCPNVKCVLKGDSDAIINLSGMEKLCEVLPDQQHLMTGRIVHFEPDRIPWAKHYVPFFVWPDNYPPFTLGFSYLLSDRRITVAYLKI